MRELRHHPRHWPAWLGLGLLWILSFLPRRALARLAGGLAGLAPRFNRKRWGLARRNLELCFPRLDGPQREEMLHRHFRILAFTLLDLGSLWLRSENRLLRLGRIEGETHLANALAQGRPVVLLTPHTPALEHCAQFITARFPDAPKFGLYKRARNPVIDQIMYRRRCVHGTRMIPREEGLRPIVRALRREGGIFYYLPDEDHGPDASVFAPFFGVPKATLPALGRIVRLTGAVVIPTLATLDPESGIYHLAFHPPLEDFPSGDEVADATRMNAVIETLIADDPAQYMWVYRLFRTRPEGVPDRYPGL